MYRLASLDQYISLTLDHLVIYNVLTKANESIGLVRISLSLLDYLFFFGIIKLISK